MLMYMKDGIPIPNSKMPTPTSTTPKLKISTPKLEAFTFELFGSLDLKPSIGDGEWMVTKVEMLYNQSKSMATRASHFAFTFKTISKMEINNEPKKVRINNLKVAKNLGVISNEDLKSKFKTPKINPKH
jgi:hypothetical protein